MQQAPPSITDLAQRLVAAYADHNRSDGTEPATDAELDAIESLISTTKAEAPADACVQIMIALHLVDGIEDPEGRERARRLLWSALPVMVRELGVDLARYGEAIYAPASADPWRASAAPAADIFADAVKLFSAAGEAELALPAAPSEALLLAGAQAAGCSLDALRRGYAAMVSAYGSA